MGQGQPRVTIQQSWLHTQFQGHQSIGSGEEDLSRFFPHMGMAAILVKWPN